MGKAKKKYTLDSQALPHCPQSHGITNFFKPKKVKTKNSALKKFVISFRPCSSNI